MKAAQILTVGLALAATTLPAVAADGSFDWTGLYAGVQGGYSFGSADVYYPNAIGASFDGADVSGWVAGIHAGANWQVGAFVLGLEGDVNWSSAYGSEWNGSQDYWMDQAWEAALVGKAGVAADRALVYAVAGVSTTEVTTNYDPPGYDDATDTTWGWQAGAGVAYAVTDDVSVRGEYRYTSYDTLEFMHGGPSLVDLTTQAVTVAVSYRF